MLKDAAFEILTFVPVIGWLAAMLFVFFLGMPANLCFGKNTRKLPP